MTSQPLQDVTSPDDETLPHVVAPPRDVAAPHVVLLRDVASLYDVTPPHAVTLLLHLHYCEKILGIPICNQIF